MNVELKPNPLPLLWGSLIWAITCDYCKRTDTVAMFNNDYTCPHCGAKENLGEKGEAAIFAAADKGLLK